MFSWIVIPLDAVEDIGTGFSSGLISAAIHLLLFELAEEAFDSGVISAAANSSK